jgi:branched-subunit amino acid transport protein
MNTHDLAADLVPILAIAAACWLLRVSFVLLVSTEKLPPPVARALEHLAPAAMASICAVEVLGVVTDADRRSASASIAVLVLAVLVAFATRRGSRALTWTVLSSAAAVLVLDLWLLPQ